MNRKQYAALLRLQLFTIGQIHEAVGAFAKAAAEKLQAAGAQDQPLEPGAGLRLIRELQKDWEPVSADLVAVISKTRREAACIPLGMLVREHKKVMDGPLARRARARAEARAGEVSMSIVFDQAGAGAAGLLLAREAADDPEPDIDKAEVDAVFKPQLDSIMRATRARTQSGIPLSSRIWQLDNQARAGINATITRGMSKGQSAWDMAKSLTRFLGAGQDCPRWTRTRLYGRTKKQLAAGDRTGLYTGEECAGQGVSYNALRVARTEIQRAHNEATTELMREAPWIEKERINLSPAHPVEDICDEIIRDGEDGQGIYPIGEIELPIHPNCMCYKTSVQPDPDDFVKDLRGWMKGESDWPAMDQYAASFGAVLDPPITRDQDEAARIMAERRARRAELSEARRGPYLVDALDDWLTGDEDTLKRRLSARED